MPSWPSRAPLQPGFTETEGFPQSWLPKRVQRVVIGPEDVAAHVLRSLEDGRGETTVPWFYSPLSPLQDVLPNIFTRVLSRIPKAPYGRADRAVDQRRDRGRRVQIGAPALPAAQREDRAPIGPHPAALHAADDDQGRARWRRAVDGDGAG